jgi:hypothetical protein
MLGSFRIRAVLFRAVLTFLERAMSKVQKFVVILIAMLSFIIAAGTTDVKLYLHSLVGSLLRVES